MITTAYVNIWNKRVGAIAWDVNSGWASVKFFAYRSFRLGIDEPYAGSIVPIKHYNKDNRVKSIMLEINRNLYMNDDYTHGPRFNEIQGVVSDFLLMIRGLR
jgi:hypothetical protein